MQARKRRRTMEKNLFGKGGEKALAQDKENCGQEESQVLLARHHRKKVESVPRLAQPNDWWDLDFFGKGIIDKVRGHRPEGKTLQGMGCQRVDTVCAPQAFGKVLQQFWSKWVPLEKGMHLRSAQQGKPQHGASPQLTKFAWGKMHPRRRWGQEGLGWKYN